VSKRPVVMAIVAHSSDFITRCGGTLAKYASRGSKVIVVSLSFGEKGEVISLWKDGKSLEEIKDIRQREAQQAADILGVEVEFLDWGDHPITFDQERYYSLAKKIRGVKPDILLTHHMFDPTNPDHAMTGDAAIKACRYAIAYGVDLGEQPCSYPVIFHLEPNLPSEQANFKPDTFIDISDTFETKIKALGKIKTQLFLLNIFSLRNKYRALIAPEIRRDKKYEYVEAYMRFAPVMGDEFIL